MEKKLSFEAERAKLKARRLAKKGFERQTGKAWDNDNLSAHEWEIYQEQIRIHEQALLDRKQQEETAALLASTIKHKELVLQQLQSDLAKKLKQIETDKEHLERFRADFEESLKQQFPSSSSAERSAENRMREEQAKKKLRSAWRNCNDPQDPAAHARRNVLVAQEDVADLNLRITNLKKEVGKLKDIAAREGSSTQIMRDEKHKRAEYKREGKEPPRRESVLPQPAKVVAPPRAHQQRMLEQQELKAKARAARLSSSSSSSGSSYASSSSSSTRQSP